MTWEQWVIAIWLIVGGAIGIATTARDKEMSSLAVTFAVIIILCWRVTMALVLHAGGFW
jgi:hypothetical protein